MKPLELTTRAKPHYTEVQLLELEHAIETASRAHHGQKRKSGENYITHPIAVAYSLVEWGMDIDTVIAGVLHDTVEDTAMKLSDIESLFGRDIAFLVDGVTKVSQARSGMRNLDSYLPETKDNLTKLMIAVGQDMRVIVIKLADRLHNMQTLKHKSREKQLKIARETLEVFAPLADRLNMGRVRVQLEELSFKFLLPQEFDRTKKLMDSRIKKSQRKLYAVRKTLSDHLAKEAITFQMDGRVKSVYSLYKKLDRVGDIDRIYDLIALRIVVEDIDTCYLALSEIHRLYTPMFDRIKDYVSLPKPNGYQSLHTTVITPGEQPVEFQIRTQDMHDYAEKGLAASFHYNEQKLSDAYRKGMIAELPGDLHWIRDLQEAMIKLKAGKSFNFDKLRVNLFSDRIFVYSPKGDIYDLPKGAMPLDYAYRVHSDLAARASGFVINGVMKPFSYILQSGDKIEVLKSKTARPKPDWREFVTTPHAKSKLRAQLNQDGGLLQQITKAAADIGSKITRKKKKS